MKDNNYEPPCYQKKAFHCPFCNAYAHQKWDYADASGDGYSIVKYAQCQCCRENSLWLNKKMIYPHETNAPFPNRDMPDDVKEIYEEARQIAHLSPRATAALLRVALEKLTEHFGEREGNLNTRIKNLKEKGLNEKIIKSADIIRVIANEGGSHAGTIDLTGKDNIETINKLFFLINIIVEYLITLPKKVDDMHNQLPEDKKQGIKKRDRN